MTSNFLRNVSRLAARQSASRAVGGAGVEVTSTSSASATSTRPTRYRHHHQLLQSRAYHYDPTRWLTIRRGGPRSVFDDVWRDWPSPSFGREGRRPWWVLQDDFFHPRSAAEVEVANAQRRAMDVNYTKDIFEVRVDVSEFEPEELEVKMVGDDRLEVCGKQTEKRDEYGVISRQFTRQFVIPEDVDRDSIKSTLAKDGYLVVSGRVKGAENVQERPINIEKESSKDEVEEEEKKK